MKSAAADLLATMEKNITDVPDYDNFIGLAEGNSDRDISAELAKIKANIYAKIPSENHNISAKKSEKNISDNNKNNSVSAVNFPEKISVPEIKEPKSGVPVTYHYSPENVAAGGAKSKFHSNVEAIKTLRKIEAEDRFATSEEQAVMAKYIGWGGIQQAFVSDKVAENISGNLGEAAPSGWENEQKELLELLSPDEYKAARASTLTSFYTPPDVADGIYQALSQFGFEGGNVLEPSMGVGNFFAKMPDEMRDNSKLYGVELDSISGRIAQQLYPNERIQVKGFEQTNFNNNSFDVVVGNIPFGDYRVSDKKYDKYNFKIHDYFAAKAVDKVKPNGVVALVTSKFTIQVNPRKNAAADNTHFLQEYIKNPDDTYKVGEVICKGDFEKCNAALADILKNGIERSQEKSADKPDFEIYQLKKSDDNIYIRFESLERLAELGQKPDFSNYDKIYEGDLSAVNARGDTVGDKLEAVFLKFNLDRPEDFKGHSLSVSDVVVMDDKAYYVDSVGFQPLKEFKPIEKNISQEKAEDIPEQEKQKPPKKPKL